MENNHNSNSLFEKNEYKFKLIYLIRKNLPKSEFLYLLMFALKYIGLILFSISLNVYDTRNNNSNTSTNNNDNNGKDTSEQMYNNFTNRPTQSQIDGLNFWSDLLLRSDHSMNDNWKESYKNNDNNNFSNNSGESSSSSQNSVQSLFRKLLINGDNYKFLNDSYQIICFSGFIILIIFVGLLTFGFFYMRKKYYSKVSITITDRMINQINHNDKFEKRFYRFLTYFLFLIIFFHQYILEYYIFGFLGYILNKFDALNNSEDMNNNDDSYNSYTKYINQHLENLALPEFLIIITNFITIFILLVILVVFMMINSSKTLYINDNYPLYSDHKNSIINFIFLNLNPIFGIINYFNAETKLKMVLIFDIIIIILTLIKIAITYYYFSPLPYKLNCLSLFVEFLALFGCIINLITYITKSEINSSKFSIIKAVFEILNALAFTIILLNKKNNNNKEIFSRNLFCTNFKTLNPGGIYYYISSYLKYSENKENNYMILFELIQNHVLNCTKKDCPGNILLPKSLSYSIFTDFEHYSNSKDKNEQQTPNPGKNKNNETTKEENIKANKEENSIIKNTGTNKKPVLKSQRSKNLNVKNPRERRKSRIINLNENIEENLISSDDSKIYKKAMNEAEFIMIGEQEIINRINFLYRRKKYDYLELYIFIHLQYLIKVKQNFRLALYYLGKYSLSEIKFGTFSQYCLYEIKTYITRSFLDRNNSNLIKDPYIKKYKDENIKLEQLMDYISLFNIVRKILRISCESIIQFYSFRRELHNSLSLQKYKNTKIYQILHSSEKIQSSILKLRFLLNNLNKDKKHGLESIELSYLICNFFKLLEGRVPQEILNNVKPILHFRDSLYDQLINEFHLFMLNNPLIIGLTEKDTFNIIYFTNIFLKKLGFSFADLKYKDFHEKLFPGNQELIKEHTLILKQFLFFYSNTYSKFNTFIKSKEGYLVSINLETKVFPTFLNDFLLIANITFTNDLENDNKNLSNINSNKNKDKIDKDKNINNSNSGNRIVNTFSFLLNTDYEIFTLTKNFYTEFHLNQQMFRELRINFCQFFCIDENKLSKQIFDSKKRLIQEKPHLNNQISLKESNRAYTMFQNIQMKNLFKIREEKILATYNYPEMYIYEKIDKKKLIKKIPEIINIIDEIGLDYDWFIKLQNYKDRLTFNIDEKSLTFNTFNSDQFFEVIFSIKKLGGIIYFVVNLNEVFNKDLDIKDYKYRNQLKKSSVKNNNKFLKKMGTNISPKFSRISIKSMNNKSRKSISANSFLDSNKILKSINDKSKTKENKYETYINGKKMINLEEKNEKNLNNDKSIIIPNKKYTKNSIYDNSEYLKSIKRKKRQLAEEDENTPLISRDRFNKILRQKEKINKILIIILYILITIILCLIIAKTIQAITTIDENLKVLDLTINFEILKVDIYLETILAIHYCIIEKQDPLNKLIIPTVQEEKLFELMEHLKDVQEYISTIINNKNSFRIFEVIEERFDIYTLNNDWNITSRKVDILEETRRLSYIISGAIQKENELCNLDIINLYSLYGFQPKSYNEPNMKQKLFFYFIFNILTNYKTTFEKLSVECAYSLLIMYDTFQKIHIYIIFGVLFFLITFIIIYCIKHCLDNSYYQLLFLYYYKIEDEQKKFETQIYYLYKTSLEFNFDNIKYFENIKNNYDSTTPYELNNKNINSNANNENQNKVMNKINEEKINNLEQNNMNGSLLNASMNGSSIQFLNKSNKLNLNNKLENNELEAKVEDIEENKIIQEETIDSLMKFIINILPNSHRYSLILTLISIVIYIGICAFSIYENYEQINKYKFSINLSMNILERVPRITELVLHSTISVLLNYSDSIEISKSQSDYIKYFTIDSLYYSEEMMQKYFQNNSFSQILKDNLKLKYNLENYLYNNEYSLFQNVQNWETLFNTMGDLCINLPKGEILSSKSNFTTNYSNLYELISLINIHSVLCKTQTPGMKDSGIKIEFNFILQEITTKYIEFITYDKSTNEKLIRAQLNFINTTEFEKIINDIKMYFGFYFNTIVYAIKKDFEKQNDEMTNNILMYSGLFFIVNIGIIISMMFIFSKGEKYKKLFRYFSTIPKDEITII